MAASRISFFSMKLSIIIHEVGRTRKNVFRFASSPGKFSVLSFVETRGRNVSGKSVGFSDERT